MLIVTVICDRKKNGTRDNGGFLKLVFKNYTFDFSNEIHNGDTECYPWFVFRRGKYLTKKGLLNRPSVCRMKERISSISAESLRGRGAEKISVKEEISRVVPVIEALANKVKIPLSIDTYKSAGCRGSYIIRSFNCKWHKRIKIWSPNAYVAARHKCLL